MADLGSAAVGLGWTDVATHVQSGNLLFSASSPDPRALAAAVAERTGVSCEVVLLAREELERVVADNPFPDEADPKALHVVFGGEPDPEVVAAAEAKAGDGEGRVVGSTLYLRTPGGIGRNRLAAELARHGGSGTARNWSTVTKLVALLRG